MFCVQLYMYLLFFKAVYLCICVVSRKVSSKTEMLCYRIDLLVFIYLSIVITQVILFCILLVLMLSSGKVLLTVHTQSLPCSVIYYFLREIKCSMEYLVRRVLVYFQSSYSLAGTLFKYSGYAQLTPPWNFVNIVTYIFILSCINRFGYLVPKQITNDFRAWFFE